ncbi:MAG: RNA polymerase sigma factor [Spirochaetales bacterium]|nr:RNA polymerase sigma factor [Spirochaetales bacterium]
MNRKDGLYSQTSRERLSQAYEREKPHLTARVRAAGKSWEEAEDLIHDVYEETWGQLNRLVNIVNLPAWLNTLVTGRLIDLWRHEKVRKAAGERNIPEETLREVIAGVGLDPLDSYVRRSLIEALNEAIKLLPEEQRQVIEAQVFGGMTFAELARTTGVNRETLKARKRYAVQNLSRTLKQWIET